MTTVQVAVTRTARASTNPSGCWGHRHDVPWQFDGGGTQHGVGPEVMAGSHARAQRDHLGDHAGVADLDPALAVHGTGRERHHRVGAERGEPAARGRICRHDPGLLRAPPGALDDTCDQGTPTPAKLVLPGHGGNVLCRGAARKIASGRSGSASPVPAALARPALSRPTWTAR